MKQNLSDKFSALNTKLEQSKNILITMSAPDGDSVGSALALYNEFKKLGKEAVVQSSFEIPRYLTFLPLTKHIVIDDIAKVEFTAFDIVILVDSGDSNRVVKYSLYPQGWSFPHDVFIVDFDHHATHDTNFAKIDIVDSSYASTCQLVSDFFDFSKINIDTDSATLLYAGMYTDTGGFIHSNATAEVYRSAADVLAKGADKETVILNFEKSQSFESILLASKALETMEIIHEDEFNYVIARLDKVPGNYDSETIENAMNILKSKPGFIRNIEGTDFGLIVSQNKDTVGVSFRARTEKFNLAAICEKFGGGGHRNACAFKSKENADNLLDMLKDQIRITLSF